MKKLGILGGTFDPIHTGHICSAQAVYEQLDLEKVLFIPAYIPPHKMGQEFAHAADRYNMTVLATEAYPYFDVSDIELKRSGVSYTIDTMIELKELYPDYELYFIIGADSVPQLHTWDRIYDLFDIVTFAAAYRPGYSNVIETACEQLGNIAREKIVLLDTPEYAVSSTEIRKRIREGKSLKGLVPEAVEEYIKKNQLYLTAE